MTVRIVKRLSKKGTPYVCLMINDVIVSFDLITICKVGNVSPVFVESMTVGDTFDIK